MDKEEEKGEEDEEEEEAEEEETEAPGCSAKHCTWLRNCRRQ